MRRQSLGSTLLGALLLVATVTAPVTLAATSTDSAPEGVHALYTDGGQLEAVGTDGSTHAYGVDVEIAGRAVDLDGDGVLETPFVDSSGVLKTTEPDGTTTRLAESAKSSKSAIAVADYDGDGTKAVFYANTSDSKYIYKVEVGESPSDPERVAKDAANGIAGFGDFDGDDETELVFAGTSSTIQYLDNGTVVSTGTSDIGSNNGYGLGDVADVNGDGTARVTVVTGSGNIALIDDEGNKETVKEPPASKSGISTVDWDGDGSLEILYRNTDGKLAYAHLDGTYQQIEDADGNAIAADASAGVVGTTGLAAPRITNYDVSNPSGREVNVSFTSDTKLSNITVDVEGPDPTALDEGAFDVSGEGPYTYTASYTADADGEYTVTLTEAVGPNDNDGAQGETGTVTIETPDPTVENATIRDSDDGDGVVGGNHTVAVSAKVPDADPGNVTVEADASAFGAGTVTLTHLSGSTWTAEFSVDDTDVPADGDQSVPVTATNQYDNTATNETGTLVVDTAPPDADAGPDRTAGLDMEIHFDGDGTTDSTEIVRYDWSFGDGTTATGMSPTHSYAEAGTYTVTLTVEDSAGNTATDTLTVDVDETTEEVTIVRTVEADSSTDDSTSTDDETTSHETANETTSVETTIVEESVHVTVTDAVDENPVTFDVPDEGVAEGDAVTLGSLVVRPDRNGPFELSISGNATAPAGVPAVTENRVTEPLAYWELNHSIDDGNVSGVTFVFSVDADRLDGASPDAVTLYRYHDGEWTAYDAQTVERTDGSYEYRVRSPGLSAFAVGIQEPSFDVVNATLSEDRLRVGGTATVTATVANNGSTAATRTLALDIGNETVAQKNVTVPAGEQRTVTFAHETTAAGEFAVSVSDVDAGTLRVAEPATATRTATATDETEPGLLDAGMPLIAPLLFLLLLGAAGLYYHRTRREGYATVSERLEELLR